MQRQPVNDLTKLFSRGNHKLGTDTFIFNMGPATSCPSKRLGLCQLADTEKCYALKAERQYPAVLPYRLRQAYAWLTYPTAEWADAIKLLSTRARNPIKYVRFNESGDFYTQACVEKLKALAAASPELCFYGYTARKDLSYRKLPPNLVIHGSGWSRRGINSFTAVPEPTGTAPVCKGNCRHCSLCKVAGHNVEVIMH